MSEVLGNTPPADDPDDQPPFADFGGDYADEFPPDPGALRRFVLGIATPEALAIAGVVIATVSLLVMTSVGSVADSLTISREFTGSELDGIRTEAVGELIVAAVAALLAITARRPRRHDGEPRPLASWVGHLSGGALLIAAVSAVFAIVALIFAGTAHPPNPEDAGFVSSISSSAAVPQLAPLLAVPSGSASAYGVVVNPSTGAVVIEFPNH